MNLRSRLSIGVAAAAVLLLVVAPGQAAPGVTTRISVATDGTQGNGISFFNAFSSDGRYAVVNSYATNLVLNDTNGMIDVFLRDRQDGTTSRVSVDSAGAQGNGHSVNGDISGDGRYVVFGSLASDLVPADTNGVRDAFVHDTLSGTTTRVSVDSGAAQGDAATGLEYQISDEGRYVAFSSDATNLVANDTNGFGDVFLRDTLGGTTTRSSVDSFGNQGNEASGGTLPEELALSADGRYLAFRSAASNLVANDTNGASDVFVHDQLTGLTERVSTDSVGSEGNAGSGIAGVAMSADGRFVSFLSTASNLVTGDTNSLGDTFVHDRLTGTTTRVSVSSSGTQATGGASRLVGLSGSGRFVVFSSDATNLVDDDTNSAADVFIHDRLTEATIRTSVDSAGAQGETGGFGFSLGDDARLVGFYSSDALVTGDTNAMTDAFVHELSDSDGDGAWDPFDAPGTGNVDCSGPASGVSSVDALKVLRFGAGLSVTQNEPCLDIGGNLTSGYQLGDVNCSGLVNSVDALLILRANAALSVAIPVGCPPIIGSP